MRTTVNSNTRTDRCVRRQRKRSRNLFAAGSQVPDVPDGTKVGGPRTRSAGNPCVRWHGRVSCLPV